MVWKVLAYITRRKAGKTQLLVFRHRDNPEAGLQVPAGTVKEGEAIEAALLREVEEETGLSGCKIRRMIDVFSYYNRHTGQWNERHVFQMSAPPDTPDSWEWIETGGGEVTEEEGYVFQFAWADLDGRLELAGGQGDYLALMGKE